MKLIIQIPCKDEAENLEGVIADLPTAIEGISSIETLVVDDGSSDATSEKAIEIGVDHVLRFEINRGLAKTFTTGLRFARVLGADIIFNTDGDNQYKASHLEGFVRHLLQSRVGMVVGYRNIAGIPHFSREKKILQRLGSLFVSFLAGYKINDAPCGFRAITKSAASKMTNLTKFTYTLETLVQAPLRGIDVAFMPVETNPQTRESRLMKSTTHYILGNARSLIVILILYKPIWIGISGSLLTVVLLAASALAYTYAPLLFTLFALMGFTTFISSWLFALLAQLHMVERIQVEENSFLHEPDLSPAKCAERLGASAYWWKGNRVFPDVTR